MSILKRFVIISMIFVFALQIGTGIVKFPEIQKYFLFVYTYISASAISMIHDWSGIILVCLILIHLLLKREGLKETFSGAGKIMYVFIGIGLIIVVAVYVQNTYGSGKKPTTLSAVEVKEYQGEKLGSVNDFRENSIKGPQYIDKEKYRLDITGLVSTPTSLTYDDILALPTYQKVVTIYCVEGWSVKALWEGVLVADLLKKATVSPQANTVIFYAVDGYSTSFPLEYIINNNIMMADKLNGVVLLPERGFPFQLVAEQKWGYKWIKWITKIELSSDSTYQGYWESRGYNNDGDLNGSKFAE